MSADSLTGAQVFRAVVRMRIRPGCATSFQEAIDRVAARVGANPTNLGQAVFRDAADDRTYYVVSDWIDQESFWAHERSPEHRSEIRHLGSLREESSMSTMELLLDWRNRR
jgi:heme oxygenase (mycobilin-producing)